jgi:hypothetical protein
MLIRPRFRVPTVVLGAALSLAIETGCGASGAGGGFGGGDDGGAGHDATGGGADAGDAHVAGPDARTEAATPPDNHDAARESAVPDAGGPHDAQQPVDSGPDSTGAGSDAGPLDAGSKHDAAPAQVPVVYGQSASVLYAINPTSKAVVKVGAFVGCDTSGVIDIALDKSSKMYATTFQGVYTVDTSNAACTLLASGTTYPNSLSFVPAGTVDPSVEALVGYQGSSYVRIDTTTGALTTIGSLGGTYSSSGDIVSVIGGGTYLTVTGGTDCSANDCLVEVNPTTGALITNYGSVQHSQVYGLAFWAGNVYGFDNAGQLFEVSFPDAGGLVITSIPIPNAPLGLSFFGAGSTTAAPRG